MGSFAGCIGFFFLSAIRGRVAVCKGNGNDCVFGCMKEVCTEIKPLNLHIMRIGEY